MSILTDGLLLLSFGLNAPVSSEIIFNFIKNIDGK